jgi:hypothetical protein
MKIRCSGLARPMVCAGYKFLETHKSPTNDAAEGGTAAGEYLEGLLLNKPLGTVASNGVVFTEDMKFFTTPIAEDIKIRANGNEIYCEHEINWTTRSGIEIAGRPDIAFEESVKRLNIEDLKYGWGIVEVFENWQLLGYAIGEVIRRGIAYEEISLKIHQPRAHHEDGPVREWVLTYEELLEYKEKIEVRMQAIVDGDRTLQTSNMCKYCEGAAEACPAFNRLFHRALEVSTELSQDSITNEELSRQLDEIKRAEEVIKIKKDSMTQLGTIRINEGQLIPNYSIVQNYGNRTWKKGVTAEVIKMMTGKDVTQEAFMTPAKAEKAGVSKEFVKGLTEKYYKGVSLEKKDSTKIGNDIFGIIWMLCSRKKTRRILVQKR